MFAANASGPVVAGSAVAAVVSLPSSLLLTLGLLLTIGSLPLLIKPMTG